MKQHLLSESITPPQSHEEYEALKESIREHGLMQPIIIFEDSILDGWHRFKACQEVGVKPRFETFNSNGTLPIDILIANSLARRNLTASQKACSAVETQQGMADAYRQNKAGKPRLKRGDIHEKSHIKCAKMFGVNETYVSWAITLKRRDPDLFNKCFRGEISIRLANKMVRKNMPNKSISDSQVRKIVQESEPDINFPDCFDSYEKIMEYSRQFCEKNGLSLQCHFVDGGWVAQYYKNGLNKKAQWQEKDRDPNLRRAIIIALREALKI